MNDADMHKVWDALAVFTNLDTSLRNFNSRSERAGKYWAGWLKESKRDPDAVKNMKDALTNLAKLIKDAKVAVKDIDKIAKGATKESLAKYASAKVYRDTVLVKQLATMRAWDQTGTKFVTSMTKVVAPFKYPKSPAATADVTVTFDSVNTYVQKFDELTKALAKF